MDPEGVDAGMPVNILQAFHFMYDEGVFDQSAWAASVPGLQEVCKQVLQLGMLTHLFDAMCFLQDAFNVLLSRCNYVLVKYGTDFTRCLCALCLCQ